MTRALLLAALLAVTLAGCGDFKLSDIAPNTKETGTIPPQEESDE